jgi:hypothetical protein
MYSIHTRVHAYLHAYMCLFLRSFLRKCERERRGRKRGRHREREGWGKQKRQKMALVRVAGRAFKVCVRVQTYDLANGRRILDGGASFTLVACSHSPSLPPSLHTSLRLCLCLSVYVSLSLLCIHVLLHLSLCFCKLIRLQNIIYMYSVSGTVDGGSVMAIMGASGSGKTTLLQVSKR